MEQNLASIAVNIVHICYRDFVFVQQCVRYLLDWSGLTFSRVF